MSEKLIELQKALGKLSKDDDEFFNSIFGKLKGNTVAEREKEVKMRLYKLQGWLIENKKDVLAVRDLFSAFQKDYDNQIHVSCKQLETFPYLKCQKVKLSGADDYCSNQDCENYRSCNWFWRTFKKGMLGQ